MLRSLWLLFLYVSFLGLSTYAPFVATLGYVWVDTFQPQDVAYIVLNQIPVAMIMGAVAVGGYLLLDRRSPPPLSLETALQIAMAIWVNATLIWAAGPNGSLGKMGLGIQDAGLCHVHSLRHPLAGANRGFCPNLCFLIGGEFCSVRPENADLRWRLRHKSWAGSRETRALPKVDCFRPSA